MTTYRLIEYGAYLFTDNEKSLLLSYKSNNTADFKLILNDFINGLSFKLSHINNKKCIFFSFRIMNLKIIHYVEYENRKVRKIFFEILTFLTMLKKIINNEQRLNSFLKYFDLDKKSFTISSIKSFSYFINNYDDELNNILDYEPEVYWNKILFYKKIPITTLEGTSKKNLVSIDKMKYLTKCTKYQDIKLKHNNDFKLNQLKQL